MSHLSIETLVALREPGTEPGEVAAREHLEGCPLCRAEFERLRSEGEHGQATYAVSLAYRIRYLLDLNAREALHLIELRSGREGHPAYRAVALEMLAQIAEVHPFVADAMTFADHEMEARLERLQGELRRHRRIEAAR